MADEPSPSEFLISKMEGMDDVTQVLIVTRTDEGEILVRGNPEIRVAIECVRIERPVVSDLRPDLDLR